MIKGTNTAQEYKYVNKKLPDGNYGGSMPKVTPHTANPDYGIFDIRTWDSSFESMAFWEADYLNERLRSADGESAMRTKLMSIAYISLIAGTVQLV